MRPSPYAVHILTARQRRVLYTGVTNDLRRRVAEHRTGQGGMLSRRYALDTLKAGSRARKIRLIEAVNPEWRDLSGEL